MFIFLDSEPSGLLSHPKQNEVMEEINGWLERLLVAGHTVCLPEIIDYELRRELIRARKTLGLALLNLFAGADRVCAA